MHAIQVLWLSAVAQLVAVVGTCVALRFAGFPLSFTTDWDRDREIVETQAKLDAVKETVGDQRDDFKALVASLEQKYVTKTEFAPIQRVVYGMIGVMLTTALLSILALIWRSK